MQRASKWKTSSRTWPTGPRKIAMPCSASSTATSVRKKVPHEAPDHGLHAADRSAADQIPDGIFLVRVQRVHFRRQAQKPYYTLSLAVLEPSRLLARRFRAGCIAARKPCGS